MAILLLCNHILKAHRPFLGCLEKDFTYIYNKQGHSKVALFICLSSYNYSITTFEPLKIYTPFVGFSTGTPCKL